MSSIIIASVPIHGHVTPLLAVARHLVARGDRVRFITGARFGEAVDATGASTCRCRPTPTSTTARTGTQSFPERAG